MKTNLYDYVLKGVTDMIDNVSESFTKEFKHSNPFDKEAMTDDEALLYYDLMNKNDFMELIKTQGIDKTETQLRQLEDIRRRKSNARMG